jgi:hypothetical protein
MQVGDLFRAGLIIYMHKKQKEENENRRQKLRAVQFSTKEKTSVCSSGETSLTSRMDCKSGIFDDLPCG